MFLIIFYFSLVSLLEIVTVLKSIDGFFGVGDEIVVVFIFEGLLMFCCLVNGKKNLVVINYFQPNIYWFIGLRDKI